MATLQGRDAAGFAKMLLAWLMVFAFPACALEVNVIGLFPGKVVITVNDGKVKILAAGHAMHDYLKLLEADSERAIFEIYGKREIITLSRRISTYFPKVVSNRQATMRSDTSGMFKGDGMINGRPQNFVLDTGAQLVTFSTSVARALDLPYTKGDPAIAITVGGALPAYRIKLSAVQLGGIHAQNVDALVVDTPAMDSVLLGMSFLNRVDMKLEGEQMIFTKRSVN